MSSLPEFHEVPEEFEWILELRSRGGKTKAQSRTVEFSVITNSLIDAIVGGHGKGSYKGELKDHVPHGEGSWTGVVHHAKGVWNGDFKGHYVGEWEDGLPHGKGKFTKSSLRDFGSDQFTLIDDGIYEGAFIDGAMEGYGELKYTKGVMEGNTLKGDFFEDNFIQGDGRCDFNYSGCSYEGEFRHNYMDHIFGNGIYYRYNQPCNGKEVFTYGDGSKFEGKFKNGKMNGVGILKYRNGDVLEGEFVDGQCQGIGEFTFGHGDFYTGEFKLGKICGKGKMERSGHLFEGTYLDGKMHGEGTCLRRNGDKYEGMFVGDEYHGQGVCTYANGDRYEGSWEKGDFHGRGELTLANGNKYVGFFVEGVAHGEGILETADGERFEGNWDHAKLTVKKSEDHRKKPKRWF